MDWGQVVTASVGTAGIIATVVVAVLTQRIQGRQQTERDERATVERRAERWEQQRFDAYRRLLAAQQELWTDKVRRDADPEAQRAYTAKVFAMDRLLSEVYLIAPPIVAKAIAEYELAHFRAFRAWEEWVEIPRGESGKSEAQARLKEENRLANEARTAMHDAIREDLRPL